MTSTTWGISSNKLTKPRSIFESIWFISLFSRVFYSKECRRTKKNANFFDRLHALTTCTNSSLAADNDQLDSLDRKFKSTRLKVKRKTVSENFPPNWMKWNNAWTFHIQQTESLNFDSNASNSIRSPTGFHFVKPVWFVAESCVSRPAANWTSLRSIARRFSRRVLLIFSDHSSFIDYSI